MPLNDSSTLYSLLDQHNSALKVLLEQQENNNNTIKSLSSNTENNSGVTSLSNEVGSKVDQSNMNNSFSNVNTSLSALNQNNNNLQNQVTQNKQNISNTNNNVSSLSNDVETKSLANSVHGSLSSQINSLNYANSELNTAIGSDAGSQISSLASQVNNFDNTTQESLDTRIGSNTNDIQSLSDDNSNLRNTSIPNAVNDAVSQANSYTDQHANTSLSKSVGFNSVAIHVLRARNTDVEADVSNNSLSLQNMPNNKALQSGLDSAVSQADINAKGIAQSDMNQVESNVSNTLNPYTPQDINTNEITDLNQLITPGSYKITSLQTMGLNNVPASIQFENGLLEVFRLSNDNSVILQRITEQNSILVRQYASNTWTNWNTV